MVAWKQQSMCPVLSNSLGPCCAKQKTYSVPHHPDTLTEPHHAADSVLRTGDTEATGMGSVPAFGPHTEGRLRGVP